MTSTCLGLLPSQRTKGKRARKDWQTQARVPAGSGRESGEFGSGGGDSASSPLPDATTAGMHPITDVDRALLSTAGAKAIPPAWSHVHVSDDPRSSLQVVGRDAKGRIQRRYSTEHTAGQAAAKFGRVAALQAHLPAIDAALAAHRGDGTHDALQLCRTLGLRPGSDADTRATQKAYGASTLEARHVTLGRGKATLDFTGKDGVAIHLETTDRTVRSILRDAVAGKQPGDRLFRTSDQQMRSTLHEIAPGFKVKDLRTNVAMQVATREVARISAQRGEPSSAREAASWRREVANAVSTQLGNTPTIALSSYINPTVFGGWQR